MSQEISSLVNSPIFKSTYNSNSNRSRSSSPIINNSINNSNNNNNNNAFILNEQNINNTNNNNNNNINNDSIRFLTPTYIPSRFKKVPVITITNISEKDMNTDSRSNVDNTNQQNNNNNNNNDSPVPDLEHQTSRFTIEKVDNPVNEINDNNNNNNNNSNNLSTFNNNSNADTINSRVSYSKPAIKKTQTKFNHDDDEIPTTTKPLITRQRTDSDNESLDSQSCFHVNYDKNQKPKSVTCSFGASSVDSYVNCANDMKSFTFYKKLLAEFIGTMFLVIYVCSIGLPVNEKDGVPSINGCLGGGLTVGTLVWCIGSISGGHVNPAVSIAFLFAGKLNPLATVLYVGFQLLGALTGAFILKALIADVLTEVNLSVTTVNPDLTLAQGFGIEFIITFILVLTVFSCVDSRRNDLHGSFPLSIGFAIVVGGLFGGPFTGGSMNPARSFGPAAATGNWKDHWIYWIGPVSGGVAAGTIYQFILTQKCAKRHPNKPRPSNL